MRIRTVAVAILLSAALQAARGDDRARVDYLREIKPLLARRCVTCHGAVRQESGLRLDAGSLVRQGGDSGAAVVPGKPEESLLIEAVTGAGGFPLMPKEGGRLTDEEIDLLGRWIAQGASSPADEPLPADPREHWAFRPPVRPSVPAVTAAFPPLTQGGPGGVRNPLDAFVEARLRSAGIEPVGEAPPHVLLRRVYLDLVGLPPTADELREFLVDDAPDAYERVVDRLLASPHYGERWGRHWMDVWRYSDWYGYRAELRNSARHIWRWRDWIVESLNEDKGYDRMVVEMLAADELAPTDHDALRATGFLARNYFKFNRHTWLDETVEHTAKAFLGVTLNCARCHDHMYDPIPQREYYAFRAIFEPHQIRTDRVPGQSDPLQDGLPRAYDADLEAPTYLFVRGNDKEPDKEHPLTAAVPAALGGELGVQPVALPPTAAYPGLMEFIQREEAAAAQRELEVRRAAMDEALAAASAAREATSASDQPVAAPRPGDKPVWAEPVDVALSDAESALNTAAKRFAAAQSQRESVDARIAADEARYATPPVADADALALGAARIERTAAVRAAEAALAEAVLSLARLERTAPGDAKERPKHEARLAAARKELDAARKALDAATKAAQQKNAEYSSFSPKYPTTSTGRRLALARWIVDEQNPLAARVAVNHVWLRHFGAPLVETVFDFGLNGRPPSHPRLLDWLACELVRVESGESRVEGQKPEVRGRKSEDRDPDAEAISSTLNPQPSTLNPPWRLKRLHRLIVTSAAYRRASAAGEDHPGFTLDRDNRLLWRTNARRMEAELLRDSVLAVAGALQRQIGGPDIDPGEAQTLPRRSIYFRHAPEKHVPFLMTFDAASTNECYRRVETVVPQQALALANSRLTREQSRRLARRLHGEVGGEELVANGSAAPPPGPPLVRGGTPGAENAAFVTAAFESILCRPPEAGELAACLAFLESQSHRLSDLSQLTPGGGGAAEIPPASDALLRARESLVHVLFNHNDFVTIR